MISNKFKVLLLCIIISLSLNTNLLGQLKNSSNQADYIIVTPEKFHNALQSFVDWRTSKGLIVKEAYLSEIYSEFPDSTKPYSIRDFISYSLTYWKTPKPKYILLVGGENFIPSYKVPSMFADYQKHPEDSVSIDEWYSVNVNDTDTQPDVDIGRFPVNNEKELSNIINKTIYFEDSLSMKDYSNDFLFLTDKFESSQFEFYANKFINYVLPSSFTKQTIFAGRDSTIDQTKKDFLNALNNGAMFVSYYGHGAPELWSRYLIFTYGDIDSIKDNHLPFILTSAACEQPFYLPNDSSIVRKLIVSAGKGTVASINSTGLNYLFQGSNFLTNLYSDLFTDADLTIGDAVLNTKIYYEKYDTSKDAIPRRYTLLGDPALKLPINIAAGVKDKMNIIPQQFSLEQNYPNPFNPSTTIKYSVPKQSFVIMKVYDALGREVSTLVNEEKMPGDYSIMFNAKSLSSGIYFYVMHAGKFYQTKKLILLK